MQAWVEQAIGCTWAEWSYEETIKAKWLFLEYIGRAMAQREEEEAVRAAEYLEQFGGAEEATLFVSDTLLPAPWAAFGNAMLTGGDPLVFPVVLAAIQGQNKGGQELIAALIAGLETAYRMGDHPQADLMGALVGAANAYELDDDGWQVLLGLVLPNVAPAISHPHHGREADKPSAASGMQRGLLAQQIVTAARFAQDEWSESAVARRNLPDEWLQSLTAMSDKPGMNLYLKATEVNGDRTAAQFEELLHEKIPAPFINYYIDAAMALEDVCCMTQFFRR